MSDKKQQEPTVILTSQSTCRNLANKADITFSTGLDPKGATMIRIDNCSGGGYHSHEWVSLEKVISLLTKLSPATSINSQHLSSLFKSRSVNTQGYLMGVLFHCGVVEKIEGKARSFRLAKDYQEKVKAIASADKKPASKKTTARKKSVPRSK